MVYCKECGKYHDEQYVFCSRCGSKLFNETRGYGINFLKYDHDTQIFWIVRIVAYFIDSLLIGLVTSVLVIILLLPFFLGSIFHGEWGLPKFWQYPLYYGIFQTIYFVIMEGTTGTTVGKKLLGLKVSKLNGRKVGYFESLLRNVSKIHFVFLFLDVFIGLYFFPVPRDKFTDKISRTIIVQGRPKFDFIPFFYW